MAGFNAEKELVDLSRDLERWQTAGDQLLCKLIVSPEFGDGANLPQLTRDLMRRIGKDLDADLSDCSTCDDFHRLATRRASGISRIRAGRPNVSARDGSYYPILGQSAPG